MQVQGYIVRETELAIAFIMSAAMIDGVKPAWLPRKKISSLFERDMPSRSIRTAQDGDRVGIPVSLNLDDLFAARVGVAT